ncbi:MAG: dTMP kinase [Candidatus Korarchaeota archaeon]|nr:dTMP kinase [Candidatus Korarchaeota archaeon]
MMLIAFEGIDGSGKTTQSKKLHEKLESLGFRSRWTMEPTSGPIGRVIKEALEEREKLDIRTLALLFAADRLEHNINEIRPLTEEGVIVISDRYLLSSLAYQGSELPLEWIYSLNQWARMPDLVIYLDLDPKEALKRIRGKGIYHSLERLEKIRRMYLELIEERPWRDCTYMVDASSEEDEVFSSVLNITLSVLGGSE